MNIELFGEWLYAFAWFGSLAVIIGVLGSFIRQGLKKDGP